MSGILMVIFAKIGNIYQQNYRNVGKRIPFPIQIKGTPETTAE